MKYATSVALVALAVAGGGCSRTKEWMRDRYVSAGQAKLKAGEWKEARLNFRKALQRDGKSAEAYFGLGTAELRLGNTEEGFKGLFNAVQLKPAMDEAAVPLADLTLAIYRANPRMSDQALPLVETIAVGLERRGVRKYDSERLLGYLAAIRKQPDEALARFRKAVSLKPEEPWTTLALAAALEMKGETEEAGRVARGYLAAPKHRAFGPLWDMLYIQALRAKKKDEGEGILKEKIAGNPKSDEAVAQLAAHYLQTGEAARCEETLGRILADGKTFPRGRATVATFYASVGRLERAAQLYGEAVGAAGPGEKTALRLRLAGLHLRMGQAAQALADYDGILKDSPKDASALRARAQLVVATGQRARLAEATGDLEKLSGAQPGDPELHFLLGQAQAMNGEAEKARGRFKLAREANPYLPGPGLALIEMDLRTGHADEAARVAAEMLQQTPGVLKLQLLEVAAVEGTGDLKRARRLLEAVLAGHPESVDARLQAGLLALDEKKFGEAERIFRKEYKKGGPDGRPLEGLLRTYGMQGQTERVLALMEEELGVRGEAPGLRAEYARALAGAGRMKESIEQFKRLAAAHPTSAELQRALGEAYAVSGDRQRALGALEGAAKLEEKNARGLTMLGMALEESHRLKEAEEAYRKAIAVDGRNGVALNNLASVMAEQGGDLDEALKFALTADRLLPGSAQVADTAGVIYGRKGMLAEAEHSLKRAVAGNPESALYRYHLGEVLMRAELKGRARKELEQALAKRPEPWLEQKIRVLMK